MKELVEIYPEVDIQQLILDAIEKGQLEEEKYLNPDPLLQAISAGEVKLDKAYGGMMTPYHLALLVKEDDKALELIEKIGKHSYKINDNFPHEMFLAVALDKPKSAYHLGKVFSRYAYDAHAFPDARKRDTKGRHILHIAAMHRRWHVIKPFKSDISKAYFDSRDPLLKCTPPDSVVAIATRENDPRFLRLAFDRGVTLSAKQTLDYSLFSHSGRPKNPYNYLFSHQDSHSDAKTVYESPTAIDIDDDTHTLMIRAKNIDTYLKLTKNGGLIRSKDVNQVINLLKEGLPLSHLLVERPHVFTLIHNSYPTHINESELQALLKALFECFNKEAFSLNGRLNALLLALKIDNPDIHQALMGFGFYECLKSFSEAADSIRKSLVTSLLTIASSAIKPLMLEIFKNGDYKALQVDLLKAINTSYYGDTYLTTLETHGIEIPIEALKEHNIDSDDVADRLAKHFIKRYISQDPSITDPSQYFTQLLMGFVSDNQPILALALIKNLEDKDIPYDKVQLEAHRLTESVKLINTHDLSLHNDSYLTKTIDIAIKLLLTSDRNLFEIKDSAGHSLPEGLFLDKAYQDLLQDLLLKLLDTITLETKTPQRDAIIDITERHLKRVFTEMDERSSVSKQCLTKTTELIQKLQNLSPAYLKETALGYLQISLSIDLSVVDGISEERQMLIDALLPHTPGSFDASKNHIMDLDIDDAASDSSKEDTQSFMIGLAYARGLSDASFKTITSKLRQIPAAMTQYTDPGEKSGYDSSDDEMEDAFVKAVKTLPVVLIAAAINLNTSFLEWLMLECDSYKMDPAILPYVTLCYAKTDSRNEDLTKTELHRFESLVQNVTQKIKDEKALKDKADVEKEKKADRDLLLSEMKTMMQTLLAPIEAELQALRKENRELKAMIERRDVEDKEAARQPHSFTTFK